jgi:hypothetical protein
MAFRLVIHMIAAVAVLAIVSLGEVASAETVQSVLARYTAWRGGRTFVDLQTIDATGDFEDGSLRGAGARYATRDGRVWSYSQFGPFATMLQVAPSGGEYTDLAGQRLPLSQLEVGYARADAALLLPFPVSHPSSLSLAKWETLGGRLYDVVESDQGDAGRYDYLIASDSGALLGVRIRRNGASSMETYSDWRMVHGVRLPFHVHDEGNAGLGALQSDTTDFNVRDVAINAPLAASTALRTIPDKSVVHFVDGASSSGWIPFHLTDGAIFLDITVNGHSARALLDSGASQTAIDRNFAATNGIAAVGHFLVGGQGGTTPTAYTPGVTIRVGGARLDGVVANVIDLQQPGTRMSPPLLVILGAEVFAETAAEIDYAGRRLRFLNPAAAPHLEHSVTLPLGLFEGAFTFPISIEKERPVPMLLDTGNDGALQLFPAYWQPRGMLQDRPYKESGNGGVGGIAHYRLATIASINIGSIEIKDVPTAFQMPGNAVSNETGILGNCGDAIFERFHLVVNFPERRITFAKSPT